MATVTAAPDPATATVTITGTGYTGPVSVTREAQGRSVPVRGGTNLPTPEGTFALIDREAPFGVPLIYRVTDTGGVTTTGTVTLEVGTPWLTHPGFVDLGYPVAIERDDVDWTPRTVLHRIIDRPDPVLTAQAMDTSTGTLTLYLAGGVPQADQLAALFADGWPILLRTPCGSLFRDGWLALTGATQERADNPLYGGRPWSLSYQRVARPTDDPYRTLPWRLMDLDATFGTLAEVDESYDTLAEVDEGRPV